MRCAFVCDLRGCRKWRFRLAHSQYIRSFLAGLEYGDDEMKDAKKHAEHLDAAVNEIFEVKMLRICEQCLNNCRC